MCPPGAAVGDFTADSADIFGQGTRRNDARSVNFLRIGPAHGLDDDDVAGIDGQHRLERRANVRRGPFAGSASACIRRRAHWVIQTPTRSSLHIAIPDSTLIDPLRRSPANLCCVEKLLFNHLDARVTANAALHRRLDAAPFVGRLQSDFWSVDRGLKIPSASALHHFCVRLKYRKSGGV
jgi:hypothetical protein